MPTGSSDAAGRFVIFEGPDGSGKTTQAARLVEWLKLSGHEVVACRDPGGTALGDRLRSILMDRSETPIDVRAEMLLFMASRAQLVQEVIRPALQRGAWVVSDRYVVSNVVYQGYAGGLDVDEVWRVGQISTGGLMPDLTLLIGVPIDVTAARIGEPRDRIEDRPEAYRRKVYEGYSRAMQTFPWPHSIVDGSGDPDEVTARVRSEVEHVLGIGPRS